MQDQQIVYPVTKDQLPCYLYDEAFLKERTRLLREKLPGIRVCFAMKAAPALAGVMKDFADRIEVCSPGEYEICLRAGVDEEKVFFSGVNKTAESIRRVLETGGEKAVFTIESEKHLRLLSEAAAKTGKQISCYIRLSGGNQFGVDKSALFRLIEETCKDDSLHFAGIHYFSGTQKKLKRIGQELTMLAEIGKELEQLSGEKTALEYGPGLSVDAFRQTSGKAGEAEGEGVDPQLASAYELAMMTEKKNAESMLDELAVLVDESGIRETYEEITFEHGRFLTAGSGVYLTGVSDVKTTEGVHYAILEGGLHQFSLFGSMSGMKLPYIDRLEKGGEKQQLPDTNAQELSGGTQQRGELKDYVLAGSLCSANDILARSAILPVLSPGDVLRFSLAGAYASTEGMALFLSRDLPGLYLRETDGKIRCIREKCEINGLNDGQGRPENLSIRS